VIDTNINIDDYTELQALDTSLQVPTVWNPRYVSNASHLTSTTKAGAIIEAHRDALALVTPPLDDLDAVWTDIARWHAPHYVDAVRTGRPRHLAQSQGFRWSPEFAESVARIWHGQHVAHQLAHVLGRAVLHPVSGAHHAHPHTGGGFCTFNYVVAALGRMKQERPQARLAVIDLDAHFGDGTYAFAEAHPELDLAIFDIAGGREQVAVRPRRRVFRVPTSEEYRRLLVGALPGFLRAQQITDAVYLAGMDPYETDPVGGIPGMTDALLAWRDWYVLTALAAYGVSAVVNFAGGYSADKIVDLHGRTIHAMQEVAANSHDGLAGIEVATR